MRACAPIGIAIESTVKSTMESRRNEKIGTQIGATSDCCARLGVTVSTDRGLDYKRESSRDRKAIKPRRRTAVVAAANGRLMPVLQEDERDSALPITAGYLSGVRLE
jgi:hypothetical protein